MSKTKSSDGSSNGQAEKPQPLTTDELAHSYERIRETLVKKLSAAKRKSDSSPDYADSVKTVSAAQDLYAYDRLVEMCNTLSTENTELREIVEMVNSSTVVMVNSLSAKPTKPN